MNINDKFITSFFRVCVKLYNYDDNIFYKFYRMSKNCIICRYNLFKKKNIN